MDKTELGLHRASKLQSMMAISWGMSFSATDPVLGTNTELVPPVEPPFELLGLPLQAANDALTAHTPISNLECIK